MNLEVKRIIQKSNNVFLDLRNFFRHNNIFFFSDLDDTITSNKNLFYFKVKFYKNNKEKFKKILQDFQINKDFISIVKKNNIENIFIISRNSQEFIDYFICNTQDIFKKYGIKIIGGIWRQKNFFFKSEDKLKMIPKGSIIISDIFECKTLWKYKWFISVDRCSFFVLMKKTMLKFFYLVKFFFNA